MGNYQYGSNVLDGSSTHVLVKPSFTAMQEVGQKIDEQHFDAKMIEIASKFMIVM